MNNLAHCVFIAHFLSIRPCSVLTENSFGIIEDHCATSSSVVTEDLNNSADALREVCPDAAYKQIEQALSHNHGDVNLAAQELLGILRQGKYNNSSKCDMHDSFTMTCLNTTKQLLQ